MHQAAEPVVNPAAELAAAPTGAAVDSFPERAAVNRFEACPVNTDLRDTAEAKGHADPADGVRLVVCPSFSSFAVKGISQVSTEERRKRLLL